MHGHEVWAWLSGSWWGGRSVVLVSKFHKWASKAGEPPTINQELLCLEKKKLWAVCLMRAWQILVYFINFKIVYAAIHLLKEYGVYSQMNGRNLGKVMTMMTNIYWTFSMYEASFEALYTLSFNCENDLMWLANFQMRGQRPWVLTQLV